MSDPLWPRGERTAVILAAAALTLLVLSNMVWLAAYSSLSRQVVGVQAGASPVTTTPPATVAPTATPVPTGVISGYVGFITSAIPAQSVCAALSNGTGEPTCQQVTSNGPAYTLSVPPGSYYVYATLVGDQDGFTPQYRAYYDQFVVCGGGSTCTSAMHNEYVSVAVTSGQVTNSIDPTDWAGTKQ